MRPWFWVCITAPFPTSSFPPTLIKYIPSARRSSDRFHVRHNPVWALSMHQNATQPSSRDKDLPEFQLSFEKHDQGELFCDMFAILVACQLIGLLDVVNDPEFVRNGGWLQPIPAIPSTLGSLVRRVGLLSCLWFPLSLLRITDGKDGDDKDKNYWITDTFYSVVLFIVIRLVITTLMNGIQLQELELLDALRDCYMVALTTTSFRYLYRQYLSYRNEYPRNSYHQRVLHQHGKTLAWRCIAICMYNRIDQGTHFILCLLSFDYQLQAPSGYNAIFQDQKASE